MHSVAYDISIQLGNGSIGALHKQFLIARKLFSGANLNQLLDEVDREIQTTEQYHSFPMLGQKMHLYKNAVQTLIGDEAGSSSKATIGSKDGPEHHKEIAFVLLEIVCMTFLGNYERVQYMYKRWEKEGEHDLKKMVSFRGAYVSFYYGLSVIGLRRKKNPNARRVNISIKAREDAVKNAAECSTWNFGNKKALLQAEKMSLALQNRDAEVQYDAAIKASRESMFVHEEGLGKNTLRE